jgi:hypothetical protein
MKSLLLISMLLVVGCAGTPRRTITVKLTPLPTLAQPHALLGFHDGLSRQFEGLRDDGPGDVPRSRTALTPRHPKPPAPVGGGKRPIEPAHMRSLGGRGPDREKRPCVCRLSR